MVKVDENQIKMTDFLVKSAPNIFL
jgi:hypothetical protein